MNIKLKEYEIKEIVEDYKDDDEEGVVGLKGKLDIRPKYQREFVYKEKQRNAVIDTVLKGFPLNVMYWTKTNDTEFEILDGQQRTISICQYIAGDFSVPNAQGRPIRFHNLLPTEKEKFLSYKLMVYICEGSDIEKLNWFRTINIAGLKLTEQELRNVTYTGPWLTDAKKYFSKENCQAKNIGGKYVSGDAKRQEVLEKAISWKNKGEIDAYMSANQSKPNAAELWLYFGNLIEWVKTTFPNYRAEMKEVAWGPLFDEFEGKALDSKELEKEIQRLMQDDDVTRKTGVYAYVLTKERKHLNLRIFTKTQKREAYERQKGICPKCNTHFEFEEMEGDHSTPWSQGGKTTAENCQMLCKNDNRKKSDI